MPTSSCFVKDTWAFGSEALLATSCEAGVVMWICCRVLSHPQALFPTGRTAAGALGPEPDVGLYLCRKGFRHRHAEAEPGGTSIDETGGREGEERGSSVSSRFSLTWHTAM